MKSKYGNSENIFIDPGIFLFSTSSSISFSNVDTHSIVLYLLFSFNNVLTFNFVIETTDLWINLQNEVFR